MRIGDTGLKVDYIVSLLKRYYPQMDSGELVAWSAVNTQYLRRYIEEHMPKMISMINLSGTEVSLSRLCIESGTTMALMSSSNLVKTSDDYTQTLGVILDFDKGSPYYEYPMRVVSIPVSEGRTYKLHINYDGSDEIYYNYSDPQSLPSQSSSGESYSLAKNSYYGFFKGSVIKNGDKLKSPGSLISNYTNVSQGYFLIKDPSLKAVFDQDIQVLSTDTLTISGQFSISSGSSFDTGTETWSVKYDILNERMTVESSSEVKGTYSNGTYITPQSGAVVTLVRSNISYILTDSSGGVNYVEEMQIGVVSQVSYGVTINTYLAIRGTSSISTSTVTGRVISVQSTSDSGMTLTNTASYDNESDIIQFNLENSDGISSTEFTLDGVKYLSDKVVLINSTDVTYGGTSLRGVSVDVEIPALSVVDLTLTVPTNYDSVPNAQQISQKINNDENGWNLLIQVPLSTTSYSLVEVEDEVVTSNIPESEFYDGSVVTTDYLDIILLGRTITEYSRSDDIDWAYDLCSLGGLDDTYRDNYSDEMREYVRGIQVNRLGRSSYTTGWIDPETEIYLEELIGY